MRAVASFLATRGSELSGQLASPCAVLKHWMPWVISMPWIDRSPTGRMIGAMITGGTYGYTGITGVGVAVGPLVGVGEGIGVHVGMGVRVGAGPGPPGAGEKYRSSIDSDRDVLP